MRELVKIRASQINGCAFCLDMHTQDARTAGESEQRIHTLSAWLAWTETVTRVSETHVPDETYESVRQHFNEKELVDLTLAIVAINGWNRLAISFRTVPGSHRPPRH